VRANADATTRPIGTIFFQSAAGWATEATDSANFGHGTCHPPCPHRLHQRNDPQHLHHPLQIVGKHMQAHLRAHPAQGLRQKMSRSHPRLDRAEQMLDCLPPEAHFFGFLIEPLLHGFKHALMFPSLDAPLLAGRALRFEQAILAGRGPVNMQGRAVLDRCKPRGQPLPRRAAIGIVFGYVDKVRLADASLGRALGC
jgi:hypothetical protein